MHSYVKNTHQLSLLKNQQPSYDNSFCDIEEEYLINLRVLLYHKDLWKSKASNKENKCLPPNKQHLYSFKEKNDLDEEIVSASSISSGIIAEVASDFANKLYGGKSTGTNSSIDSISLHSDSHLSPSRHPTSLRINNNYNLDNISHSQDNKRLVKIYRRSTEITSPKKLNQFELEDKRKSVLLVKNQLTENMNAGSEICHSCSKRVYPFERTSTGKNTYHKTCFRCSVCNRTLLPGNFAALDGIIFCKPHYIEKFRIRGKYETVAKPNANDLMPVEKTVAE